VTDGVSVASIRGVRFLFRRQPQQQQSAVVWD